MGDSIQTPERLARVPWWTSVLVFLILHVGSQVSLLARHDLSISDYYLPTAFAVVLIYWLGPRHVLPAVYLNAVVTSPLWGNSLDRMHLWFVFAIPETVYPFLSWFLFKNVYQGKYWLPDISNTVLFLVMGVLIPVVIETLMLQSVLVLTGDHSIDTYPQYIVSNLLSEFTTTFFITLPALYYITPRIRQTLLLKEVPHDIYVPRLPGRKTSVQMVVIFACLLALVFVIDFREYWFVYGFLSLYVAIRFGFGAVILTNFYTLVVIYILPKLFDSVGKHAVAEVNDVTNVFFGACLLFVFAAITGRVISDLRLGEKHLTEQNAALVKANKELDRFVYSVYHDLSAPLKSILGLVNITRITRDTNEHLDNLGRIEVSVKKLEAFIAELVDYSKNKRQKIAIEKIDLGELCDELMRTLLPPDQNIRTMYDLRQPEVFQDRTRLKIILNNFLSNAIRYQKSVAGHCPSITISSWGSYDDWRIAVEDNGEGIRDEQLTRIFDMFYRGNEKSKGSGLGLYIAREASEKINGEISVESRYGEGSRFVLHVSSKSD